mgnify:CR=1 FL=1
MTEENPSFSVIVPCYNYARYLRQSVTSVLRQDTPRVRVLILDDASHDETPAVARELCAADSRVEYLRNKTNIGHIATYNIGIDWADGDYFLLLSADDYLVEGAFERAAHVFRRHPTLVMTYGKCLIVDANAAPTEEIAASHGDRVFTGQDFIRRSGIHNLVPTPTAIVRTDMQRLVGHYRQELPHTGDLEMWLRFAAHGDIAYIDAVQAAKREHGQNMAGNFMVEWLPDVEQRGRAIDMFVQAHAAQIEDLDTYRRQTSLALAKFSLGCARSALLKAEFEKVEELVRYAECRAPEVRKTKYWSHFKWLCRLPRTTWRLTRATIRLLTEKVPHLAYRLSSVVSGGRYRIT